MTNTTTTGGVRRIKTQPFLPRGVCLGDETIHARHSACATPRKAHAIKTQQVIMAVVVDEEEEKTEEDKTEEDKEEMEEGISR